MRKKDIPTYCDSADFERLGGEAKFPCDTQYMIYNPMLHRYYLTEEGAINHGIDLSEFETNERNRFLEQVSKKVYDYIQYKSGRNCYEIQMYRIATAPKTIYPDQYFMRKQFESALADQARFILANGDSAQVSRFSIGSSGEVREPQSNPSEMYRDTSDIAPECIRTLETLGLTNWFKVSQFTRLDLSKF